MTTTHPRQSTMTHEPFIERLIAIAGEDAVDTRPAELRYFAEDALRGRGGHDDEPALPIAIVRPATARAVAAILAACTAARVAVVAYGAGTGLMGGARHLEAGIVLDTNGLNSVEVQPADRLVWAGSGAILADVDAVLRPHGLNIGHDPWTFPVATVGGTLSTNSLGYRGGRYGGMGDQALALEVALADGTLMRTRAVRRHSAGPNLGRLFIGAEGTLGIITAAALEAFPIAERQVLRAYNFPRFEDGFAVIEGLTALGMRPSLLDYGEEHASPWPQLASREDEPPLLYLGFEGFEEEVEAYLVRSERLIAEHGGVRLPDAKAQTFWDDRHVVAQRFARGRRRDGARQWRSPDAVHDYMHVALPPSQVLPYRERLHAESQASGVGLLECGLWVKPDFFSAVLMTPAANGGRERLSAFMDRMLMSVQDAGGSMEYVHGAGVRLAHLMQREHGVGLDVLRQLKATLDPAGILNPGKLGL